MPEVKCLTKYSPGMMCINPTPNWKRKILVKLRPPLHFTKAMKSSHVKLQKHGTNSHELPTKMLPSDQ